MLSRDEYNYARFDRFIASGGDSIFETFRDRNHAGERAPDGELTRLGDGASVRLSSLWAARPIVLEFGSFT